MHKVMSNACAFMLLFMGRGGSTPPLPQIYVTEAGIDLLTESGIELETE